MKKDQNPQRVIDQISQNDREVTVGYTFKEIRCIENVELMR